MARYTLEFKQRPYGWSKGPEHRGAHERWAWMDQTACSMGKAHRQGKLTGADSKVVSVEQMEISRLRAELARVRMERDILGKATAYFAKASK